jgi:glycosyltransferase involved in cell wall biosynthesis
MTCEAQSTDPRPTGCGAPTRSRVPRGLGHLTLMQVNTMDRGGGAEQMALALHDAALQRGGRSSFVVGRKFTDRQGVIEMPHGRWWRGWNGVARRFAHRDHVRALAKSVADPMRVVNYLRGAEDFQFPATHRLLGLLPDRPDLVHLHNLHGGYFDLRFLPRLSRSVPTVVTLHDAWLLAGHCAHSLDCQRWRTGCGKCPYLDLPMRVRRDRTATNWLSKQAIYRQCRLHIATPSRWLMNKVEQSMLAEGIVEARVIPNGVDTEVFCPGNRQAARRALGLPADAQILLSTGHAIHKNPWKDMATVLSALERLNVNLQTHQAPLIFLALGQQTPPQRVGRVQVLGVPYVDDVGRVAEYYRAADIYVHAARADTFPLAVLEAMACGTPVVATEVGGIPEQINNGQTGLLMPLGDHIALADAMTRLLDDEQMRVRLGKAAAAHASQHYSLRRVTDEYSRWYETLAADPR